MKTIFKYPLSMEDETEVSMPADAEILCVQMQRVTPCIWAKADTDAEKVTRRFRTYGTGHKLDDLNSPEKDVYVGTYQAGDLVFHVFERVKAHGLSRLRTN